MCALHTKTTIIATVVLAFACVASPAQVVVDASPGQADLHGAAIQLPCLPLGCYDVETGPFKPDEPDFTPDRRPGVTIATWNSSYGSDDPNDPDYDPLGLTGWWTDYSEDEGLDIDPNNEVPDVFDNLLDQLNLVYDRGFRRITLRLPAGYPKEPNSNMSSSQWRTMPRWRRKAFKTFIADWINARRDAVDPVNDLSFGIYAGFEIYDPCLFDLNEQVRRTPDYTSELDMCIVHQNVAPWIGVGAREYWMDFASNEYQRASFVELAYSPNYRPAVRLGGEAFPIDGDCNNEATLDWTAVPWTPWMALWRYADSRLPANQVVDPGSTELVVIFDGHQKKCGADEGDHYVFDDVRRYHDRGFVLWAGSTLRTTLPWSPNPPEPPPGDIAPFKIRAIPVRLDYAHLRHVEAVQRTLSFGEIDAGADFNNDGFLNDEDADLFTARYNENLNQTGMSYLDGDMDADGDVDQNDWNQFFYMYARWTENGCIVSLDLDTGIMSECPTGGD